MKKAYPIRLDYYQYCVETWIEIFKQIDFLKVETVVDLCLGWAPKIELALLKTGFKGKLYAVDKSQDNLKAFLSLIDPFEKQYQIILKQANILEKNNLFKNKADIIVANHIIDDLILNYYLKEKNIKEDDLFFNIDLLKKSWLEISKNEIVLNKVCNQLTDFIVKIVNPKGSIIISQYPGYQEKLYGLDEAYIISKKLLKKLKHDLLFKHGFQENKSFIEKSFYKSSFPYFNKENVICLSR